MRDKCHGSKKWNIIAVLCLVLAALSLSVTAFVAAKYSSKIQGNIHGVIPANFQLECTPYEDGHEYFVMEGTANINFDVTSTAEHTMTCYPITSSTTINSGTLYTYTLDTSAWAVGDVHTVTVATTAPYAKKITFKLRVVAQTAESSYSIKTFPSRVELTLNIGSTVPTNVSIHYGTLAPDNLNKLMEGWMTANNQGILSGLQPYSKYTLIFFGTSNMTDVASAALIDDTTINLIVPAQAQTTAKNGAPASQ